MLLHSAATVSGPWRRSDGEPMFMDPTVLEEGDEGPESSPTRGSRSASVRGTACPFSPLRRARNQHRSAEGQCLSPILPRFRAFPTARPPVTRGTRRCVDAQASTDVDAGARDRGGDSEEAAASPTASEGENVDMQSEAVQEAIRQQLRFLGGDPETESHLLPCVGPPRFCVRNALVRSLPRL